MGFTLLLDENIEHAVLHELDDRGHDVRHVDFVSELGKGAADSDVTAHSRRADRAILSYDDDFRDEFDRSAYYGFIFVPDETLSSEQIARILDAMSQHFDQQDLHGVHILDTGWL